MNNLCRATTHPFQYNQNPLQLFQARDKLLRWTSRSVLLNVSPQNKLKKRECKFWNRLAENKLASQGFFMVCLAEDRPSSRLLPNKLDLKYNGDSNNLPLKLLSYKKIKENPYLNSTQLHRLRRVSQRNSQLIRRNLFVCAVEKRVGRNQPGLKTKSLAALGKYHRLWRIWSPFLGFFSVPRT